MSSAQMSPAPGSKRIGRACDECRGRKVKCDASEPQCSNCRISALQCTYATPNRKRGPRIRSQSQRQQQQQRQGLGRNLGEINRIDESHSWPPSPSSGPDSFSFQDSPGSTFTPTSHTTSCHTNNNPNLAVSDTLAAFIQSDTLASATTSIRQKLINSLHNIHPDIPLDTIVSQSLDSFMQYLFPQAPLIHERTLRDNTSIFDPNVSWNQISPASPLAMTADGEDSDSQQHLSRPRKFILLTAVCAVSAAHNSTSFTPTRSKLSEAFLVASRKMLILYHDADVESPDSSSGIYRILHSAALHAVGETRLSWLVLGEAIRLSQDMQVQLESSFMNLDPVEAQLRRNLCCVIYTADRSAAILNNRPLTLGEMGIQPQTSVPQITWDDTPLMDRNKSYNTEEFEHCIATGFGMIQRVWSTASDLLLELRLIQRRFAQSPNEGLTDSQVMIITKAYVDFMSVLDDTPSWFNNPETAASQTPATTHDVIGYQIQSFWVQRANIEVTFHCLRLIILKQYADCNLSSLLGVSDQSLMIILKKTEIAQDMLRVIQNAPFEALKKNGEPCVEKIRQVGAILLEIAQNVDVPQIATRAKSDLSTLLDILTRLDSSVSNTLRLT